MKFLSSPAKLRLHPSSSSARTPSWWRRSVYNSRELPQEALTNEILSQNGFSIYSVSRLLGLKIEMESRVFSHRLGLYPVSVWKEMLAASDLFEMILSGIGSNPEFICEIFWSQLINQWKSWSRPSLICRSGLSVLSSLWMFLWHFNRSIIRLFSQWMLTWLIFNYLCTFGWISQQNVIGGTFDHKIWTVLAQKVHEWFGWDSTNCPYSIHIELKIYIYLFELDYVQGKYIISSGICHSKEIKKNNHASCVPTIWFCKSH
jgi:hypothetical protein